jgi:hypothetical protein
MAQRRDFYARMAARILPPLNAPAVPGLHPSRCASDGLACFDDENEWRSVTIASGLPSVVMLNRKTVISDWTNGKMSLYLC